MGTAEERGQGRAEDWELPAGHSGKHSTRREKDAGKIEKTSGRLAGFLCPRKRMEEEQGDTRVPLCLRLKGKIRPLEEF